MASEPPFKRSLLRVATAGSVDDGKSTLIGRLLLESKTVYTDQVQAAEDESEYLAQITDGLRAEREQGITIDVAYRYLTTQNRRIIIADTPGHEQYTRNMVTGASNADVALVLIDATKGVTTQTKRHAFIASIMGVPRIVLAVNKMDLVKYSEDTFDATTQEFLEFASKLTISDIEAIPLSAMYGDNVFETSRNTAWYSGKSLYQYLDNLYIDADKNKVDFRLPVQSTMKVGTRRLVTGQIASGTVKVNEDIVVLPSLIHTQVKQIVVIDSQGNEQTVDATEPEQSIALELTDEIDVPRGAMLVRKNNIPHIQDRLNALIVWMDTDPLNVNQHYYLQHTTNRTKCKVTDTLYKLDVNNLKRVDSKDIGLNEIARVKVATSSVVCVDSYRAHRATGGFILINPESNRTVACGVVLDGQTSEDALQAHSTVKSENIHHEVSKVSRTEKEQRTGHKGFTLWFTGLSASGKSTLAKHLERELFDQGKIVARLDGDNMRHGLNADLGFAKQDRTENIRRLTHVAKLFNDAGVICIVCAISPIESDREFARSVIEPDRFRLIHLSTSLEACEQRDPRGLYQKARSGEIESFTGVSAPFEEPLKSDLQIDTAAVGIEDSISQLLKLCNDMF